MRAALLVVAACSFHLNGVRGDAASAEGADGATDASPDAPPSAIIYAVDPMSLYAIDLVQQTTTAIGKLHDASGADWPGGLDSIALVEGVLVGVSSDGKTLVEVDVHSALVTTAMPKLPTPHTYWGATYDPTTQQVLGAANDTATLYNIDYASDATTPLGTFGSGLTVYGDIAWLDGLVYGTMAGTGCNQTCIVTIDPTSGAATIVSTNAPVALPSLSAYDHALYGIQGAGAGATVGDVYRIDTSGVATRLFNAAGKDMGDSAP